jgi:hypothetical protein
LESRWQVDESRAPAKVDGDWLTEHSGAVDGTGGERWKYIDAALRLGLRGLPGGETLPQLLGRRCGVRTWSTMQALTEAGILAWADAEHARSGNWPTADTGPIREAPGESWNAVDVALRGGGRSLPGGSSLAQLLAEHRGVRNKANLPPLTIELIAVWGRAHHQRKGEWPTPESWPVEDAPGETWRGIDQALHNGHRGLAGGSSLYQLLRASFQIPGRRARNEPPPEPTEGQLRLRIDRMRDQGMPMAAIAKAMGMTVKEVERLQYGLIRGTGGETWASVNLALHEGFRGLPGGSSLARLLASCLNLRLPSSSWSAPAALPGPPVVGCTVFSFWSSCGFS